MACEQCNVIYSNADVPEINIEQIQAMARNLAEVGTAVVLLIGGEPFARTDIEQIVAAFRAVGIHVRLQTNGIATRQRLQACVEAGANDISISLDSLEPETQDVINGQFERSWERAIRCVADVNAVFPEGAFAFFGCVLAPRNLDHIAGVIKFATAIGWGVSLVPAHVSPTTKPMGFRTFDSQLLFPRRLYPRVREVLDEVHRLRRQGYNVYDSEEYTEDIYRFVTGQPVQWRRRNGGVCDSPNLYFAIEPDGNMAVCCDIRLNRPLPVYHPDFPEWYRSRLVHREVEPHAKACTGCMYGSYPEMTISARYLRPMLRRAVLFNARKTPLRKCTATEMMAIAERIRAGESVPA
jgi:MoaA/NifB/PqqE/SkfB family radical SAM enzyme